MQACTRSEERGEGKGGKKEGGGSGKMKQGNKVRFEEQSTPPMLCAVSQTTMQHVLTHFRRNLGVLV